MTFPIRKSARKLTGIVKITIPEVFPEMKPLGNVIIFPVVIHFLPTTAAIHHTCCVHILLAAKTLVFAMPTIKLSELPLLLSLIVNFSQYISDLTTVCTNRNLLAIKLFLYALTVSCLISI